MSDRFRDLEISKGMQTKDFVLMATVTNFDELPSPGKTDLKQFSELFEPLFLGSSDAARHMAVAVLTKSRTLPRSVALFIGCQPISIAAPFLAASPAIDDDCLLQIVRRKGAAHAKAIGARRDLSRMVRNALASTPPNAANAVMDRARDDQLVHLARQNDAHGFLNLLAEVLYCSRWLAAHIMLDVSGLQLATALVALDMSRPNIELVLTGLYPHLGSGAKAAVILDQIAASHAVNLVNDWIDADACITMNGG